MRKETCLLAIFLAVLFVGLLYGVGPTLAATPTPIKVSEMTPVTTVTPDSLLYIVQDPASTPVSRHTSVEAAVHAGILPISIDGLNIVIGGNVQITGTTSISGTTIVSDTLTVDTLTLPDHTHDGTANSGSAFDAANLASGTAITNTVLTAGGDGSTSWLTPTTQIHDHSSDNEGGAFDAANLTSGGATDGYVLTSDGAGGAAWEQNVAGGYTQGCRVFNSANIATSNDVPYTLTFDSELYDTDTMHSTVSATDRITITTTGVYLVWANVAFAYDADGVRVVPFT
jgi:hypothetical protein